MSYEEEREQRELFDKQAQGAARRWNERETARAADEDHLRNIHE